MLYKLYIQTFLSFATLIDNPKHQSIGEEPTFFCSLTENHFSTSVYCQFKKDFVKEAMNRELDWFSISGSP
jgi:hypothetical protein